MNCVCAKKSRAPPLKMDSKKTTVVRRLFSHSPKSLYWLAFDKVSSYTKMKQYTESNITIIDHVNIYQRQLINLHLPRPIYVDLFFKNMISYEVNVKDIMCKLKYICSVCKNVRRKHCFYEWGGCVELQDLYCVKCGNDMFSKKLAKTFKIGKLKNCNLGFKNNKIICF
ncbi:Maph57 [Matsumuraeses phaseoli granulovirus]|uniref:Maph57 n=1 Tax=Matsumuraeses phaseoli granulovirus TaxID=2760664 RepID=A0AAE7MLD3_9BBAC|nr:Maph57 [Matsumuraeses phaseoli granulovirus]QOD40020.1 Maph57 [Matsumuraeses phaseoli granulovirus]